MMPSTLLRRCWLAALPRCRAQPPLSDPARPPGPQRAAAAGLSPLRPMTRPGDAAAEASPSAAGRPFVLHAARGRRRRS